METVTRTTCPYCGVGCGVIATVDEGGSVSVKGDPDHPANFGRLCSKGSALAETLSLDDRLLHPEVGGIRASWDEALDLVAGKFAETIREHGPDSVAFYGSGQFLTEDYYVANKLMKGFIGSGNIDTNSRLCMASSVAGHKRAFGSDTVPGTYTDLEAADLVVLVGSNLAWCHPVVFQRIAAAKDKRPDMKVVTVDPRRTATSEIADLHLSIAPGGDVALFNGLLVHLTRAGAVDSAYVADHTVGLTEALNVAAGRSADLEADTGLSRADLDAFFDLFAGTEKVVTVYSQGVNQSVTGTDKVNAIINCHLLTGRIGREGMGPFSITGQPNAMGGREVGGLANQLAAHMDIGNPDDHDRVGRFWQAPALAHEPGLKAVDLFKAVADGSVKAVWIMATNPVDSLPNADEVARALELCPFVVVTEVMKQTDATKYADVLLPALGWGEKDGTVTNSERRVSRQRAFLDAPGEARGDWWILTEVACRMGFASAFAYERPADVFREHAALSGFENEGNRDFDLSGLVDIDDKAFDEMLPVQWPFRAGEPTAQASEDKRFFSAGRFYTPDRKARFIPTEVKPLALDAGFDMLLNTGRVRDQWHTMTRTGKAARLTSHIAEPFAELNPVDADRLGILPAGLVEVTSRYGRAVVRALVTERQRKGSVFVPMHWTGQNSAKGRIDAVVAPPTDPISGQPGLKATAVNTRPYAARWYGFAVLRDRPETIPADYFALGRSRGGYRLELAGRDETLAVDALFDALIAPLPGDERLAYHDRTRHVSRHAVFRNGVLVAALFVGPEPVAASRSYLVDRLSADAMDPRDRLKLLAGRAGAEEPDKGAIVCSCFDVGVNTITEAILAGTAMTVDAVGKALRAGTNCGSCRSEIGRLIDACCVQKTG
ncbi:molybdopterin-dependent oxidoreductase [Hartmannibacter diazotrophicus]|uniref:nitrate reductase n=1 Tax=Hartmannibacter diazotrophicus TaxID=1482074 RepID=UPI003CCBED4E